MNEERVPSSVPEEPLLIPENPRSSMGLEISIAVFVLIAGVAVCYAWLQHNTVQRLSTEETVLRDSLAAAKSQEIALTARVDSLSAAQAQEEASRARANEAKALRNELSSPASLEARKHATRRAATHGAPDDPRWKQLQERLGDQQRQLADNQKELADTQRQIAETKTNLEQAKSDLENNLQSARTDLSSDIARNHDELVALEKKGDRNYYEFSFKKSLEYHHTGPISIALHKADAKKAFCDLGIVIDDKEMTRKHVNLYDAIALIPGGYNQPLELVINRIDKNAVQGYLSEPKYHGKEQAAAPIPPPTTAVANLPAPAAPDSKLERHEEATH